MLIKRAGGGGAADEAANRLQVWELAGQPRLGTVVHTSQSAVCHCLCATGTGLATAHGMSEELPGTSRSALASTGAAEEGRRACLVAFSAQTGSCSVCNEPTLACRTHFVPG